MIAASSSGVKSDPLDSKLERDEVDNDLGRRDEQPEELIDELAACCDAALALAPVDPAL